MCLSIAKCRFGHSAFFLHVDLTHLYLKVVCDHKCHVLRQLLSSNLVVTKIAYYIPFALDEDVIKYI